MVTFIVLMVTFSLIVLMVIVIVLMVTGRVSATDHAPHSVCDTLASHGVYGHLHMMLSTFFM